MSLVIDVDSLDELDRVMKRLIPLAPVTPSTPVAPPVASPVAQADLGSIHEAGPKFPIPQRIEDDTAHHNRVQAAVAAVVAEHGSTLQKLADTPSPADMEAAVKAYGRVNGFDKARALLNEYGAQKLGDVPAAKRAELYGRLTA